MESTRVFGAKLGFKLSIRSQANVLSSCKPFRFPPTSFPGKPPKLVPLKATTNTLACEDENNRKFKKMEPSEWGHQFIDAHVDVAEMDSLGREIEALKPKVGDMFLSSSDVDSTKKNILFIYLLMSLGVAYHFEAEIEENLKEGLKRIEEMLSGEDDLYTVSIIFWVFRSYGHNLSPDVFKRFKGENGKFKECLAEDTKGILSLYEAAQMGTMTEYILDEASGFVLSYLEPLVASGTCQPHLSRRIQKALGQPQHRNMEILVAMEYIRFYEQEEDYDKTLLMFAKLNFKYLQLHYLQELKGLSKWYKEKDFESNLPPYYRDRFVEMHVVALAYLEPNHSHMLREVESLANAIERWDLDDPMDGQPIYLKFVVKFIFDTFQEFEREVASELGGSDSLKATIEEFKRLTRANLQLAKWAEAGHVPSFDEYLKVAGIEIAVDFTLFGILVAMKDICKEEAVAWLKSRNKLAVLMHTVGRVRNDIFGLK
ncbi:unnamed protein product, partial [Eruca vesicaria subsp. sativa]|nr:unnamed protein product [Eruca vesicaria subsp. sativa]